MGGKTERKTEFVDVIGERGLERGQRLTAPAAADHCEDPAESLGEGLPDRPGLFGGDGLDGLGLPACDLEDVRVVAVLLGQRNRAVPVDRLVTPAGLGGAEHHGLVLAWWQAGRRG